MGLCPRDDHHEAAAAVLCKCHLCEEKCNEYYISFSCRFFAFILLQHLCCYITFFEASFLVVKTILSLP